MAPISSVPSAPSSIPLSSSSPPRSTSASGDPARAFITLINVWPPARARAPSFAASSPIASARDDGLAYSTSRRSISGSFIKCLIRPAQVASAIRETWRVERPDVHYAHSGDVAVAYQVVGDGSPDIVFLRGLTGDLLS